MSVVANSPAAWSERAGLPTPWEASLWTREGQQDRFKAVLGHLPLEPGDSLLDFGAGPGEFSQYLPPHVGYYAFDWAQGMRERVAREHPQAAVLEELPPRLFDHVVAIGCFNLADGWWKQRTWDTLGQLWAEHTRRSLTVSLYRGDDPDCLVYTDLDASAFARQMGCRLFLIDQVYRENDLTLHMRR